MVPDWVKPIEDFTYSLKCRWHVHKGYCMIYIFVFLYQLIMVPEFRNFTWLHFCFIHRPKKYTNELRQNSRSYHWILSTERTCQIGTSKAVFENKWNMFLVPPSKHWVASIGQWNNSNLFLKMSLLDLTSAGPWVMCWIMTWLYSNMPLCVYL